MTQVFRSDFNKADDASISAIGELNGGSGDDAWSAGSGFSQLSLSSGQLQMLVSGASTQIEKSGLAFGAAGGTVRVVMRTPTAGASIPMVTLWTTSKTNRVCSIGTNSSNQFSMRNAANSSVGSASSAWTANSWYALEITPTNSTGTYKCSAYAIAGDGTETLFWSTTQATGRADCAFDVLELGKSSSTTATGAYRYEYAVVDTDTNVYLGPDNLPPTATITANQSVATGATVTVEVDAVDPEGGTLTYAWSVISPSTSTPTLSGSTTDTITFTAPATGLVTLQCVVTDSGTPTGSVTKTTEVRIPVTGSSDIYPMALAGTGTFVNTGGASSTGAALADASNTTYLETPSALSGTEQTHSQRLQPAYSRNPMNVVVTLGTDSGTATALVRLKEGASGTVRKSWTQSINTTPTDYTLAVDSTSIASITDPGHLIVEVGFTS